MRITWNSLARSEWERLTADAPLQQAWAFGDALEEVGPPVLRAVARDGGAIRALAQFSIGNFFHVARWALCTRGPVWIGDVSDAERAEILQRLRVEAPLKRPHAVVFMPDAPVGAAYPGLAGLRRVMTGLNPVHLDLTQDLDSLRDGLHGKWRNRLRAAEKAGLSILPTPSAYPKYRWLLDKESEQKRRHRYLSPPTTLAPAFKRASGHKGALRIWQAQKSGETVAAMMFLRHGRAATYHIGWSSEVGRQHGAHNLLLWRAIDELRADGVRRLDLGEAETDRGAGLARFKLGVGGQPVTLCGAYL